MIKKSSEFDWVIDNIPYGYIKSSNIHGNGLFATADLLKGAIIGTLDGQVMSWVEYKKIFKNIKKKDPIIFGEWNALSKTTLLVRPFRTKYSFINHSREPNCYLAHYPLRIVTLRDIKKDEELFLDYRQEPLCEEYLNGRGKTYL